MIFCVMLLPFVLSAQNDTIKYSVSLTSLASKGEFAPFWLQSLDYGRVFNGSNTSYASASVFKEYGDKRRVFDYGFKADFMVRTDVKLYAPTLPLNYEYYFHELYAKSKLFGFNLIVGAKEEILGNQDSTLSSGGLLFSRNARPIPKITFGLTDFTALPGSGNMIFIKGGLSHGQFLNNDFSKATNVKLHHKYLYLRLVGIDFPVWGEIGLDHFAQWGGVIPEFGKINENLVNYSRIFFGKKGGSDATISDQVNAFGNHLISQSVKGGANLGDYKISAYWQNFSEDGPLKIFWGAMNKEDGLFGFSVKNKKFPIVQGLLYEFLNTTDQSGPYHDKDGMVYGGHDSYFLSEYGTWSYFGRTIGVPFITSPVYNKNGSIKILNNTVLVHHVGMEGNITGFNYKLLGSYVRNYGNMTFTSMKPNTSLLLEVNKKFGKTQTLETKLSLGADFGEMYGTNLGAMFSIKKTGDLFRIKSPRILGNPAGY